MRDQRSPAEVAAQISDALQNLEWQAKKAGLGTLTFLLQMARVEAENVTGQIDLIS